MYLNLNMGRIGRLLSVLAIVWWGASLAMLYRATHTIQERVIRDANIVSTGDIERENYIGIYYGGEKIGYSSKVVRRGKTGLLVSEVSYMKLPLGGINQEVLSEMLASVGSDFSLLNFDFSLSSGGYESRGSGFTTDEKLILKLNVSGQPTRREFPIGGRIYLPSLIPEMYVSSGMPERLEVPTVNPLTLSYGNYLVKRIGIEDGKKFNINGDVYHLFVSTGELYTEMWVDSKGNLIMERSPGGFVSYMEPKEKALSFPSNPAVKTDLLSTFSIPVQTAPDDPRDVSYLRTTTVGLDPAIFELTDFNQRYTKKGDSLVIEVFREPIQNIPPITPSDTASTEFIQASDRRIKKAAKKIIGDETDTLKMLLAINSWLYENIKKRHRATIPNALAVLRRREGDCNEHSTLFCALARSLGIPTRIMVGVVLLDDAFFYHTWVASYAEGNWHSFDPTLGVAPADAARIKLLSGELESQIQLLRIERLYIRIDDYEKDKDAYTQVR